MPSSLAAAAAGINSLSINKKKEPKKPAESKKSSLLAAAASSSSSAPSTSSKSNHSKQQTTTKKTNNDTRSKDSNTHNTNKKKQQQKPHTKSSLTQKTKPKEKVVAQFEFSLDSSSSDHEESFKNTSNKPKHTDQRERKIDVAVSKRLIGHALNQKSTHCNGHLYGNSLDETQGNRKNHGNNNRRNHSNQDDGSHSTLRYSNRNKDRKSQHENRNSRKNKHNEGPPSRNDRWNHDFSSTKPPPNRHSNKKSSGNGSQNGSVPKPSTKVTKPEFHIISSSEAIGVAAASNWAEDSDSDEGW